MSPATRPSHDGDEPTNRDIMFRINDISSKFDRLDGFITGAHEPEKGLIVRIDRMEQAHKARAWWTKSALGAAITAIITSVVSAINAK